MIPAMNLGLNTNRKLGTTSLILRKKLSFINLKGVLDQWDL
jgi:hypothetical protein